MVKTYKTMMDVFNDPFLIGFSREFDRLNSLQKSNSSVSYPPYNLIKIDEDNYRLDLALAGFDKKNVEVTVTDGSLLIKGEREEDEVDSNFVYRGIATRKFTRSFALGEYMEVDDAQLSNGILSVSLTRIVPEEKKPKAIKVK